MMMSSMRPLLAAVASLAILACGSTSSSGSACATLAACCPAGSQNVGPTSTDPVFAACTTPTNDEAQCASSLAMLHELGSCLPDAGKDAATRTCASSVQSVTFDIMGSCSPPGTLTLGVETAGACTIGVVGEVPAGIPVVGEFGDEAAQTGYDLTKGNWALSTKGSTITDCVAASSGTTTLNLACQTEVCLLTGGDADVSCTSMGACNEVLTRVTPDGG